jgi:glycosyltransferase involved in cell wall biosynthesis
VTTLHQVIAAAAVGDAITDQAFMIQTWLRRLGFTSELYAQHVDPALESRVRSVAAYRPGGREPLLIYHHSLGFEPIEQKKTPPLLLIYHNITPPGYFTAAEPAMAQLARLGLAQLPRLAARTRLALADSGFNELDLQQAGYPVTDVLPIAVDPAPFAAPVNQPLLDELAEGGPVLLFVGRVAPNKRQEDLIKLLYAYRQIRSDARVILVGQPWSGSYTRWLRKLAADLGLEDAVSFTGPVSDRDLVTYYRGASLYVSMSEHEGFGKPLVESMLADLPVLAYAATAVPWTMGRAGVLFQRKAFAELAELVEILVADADLRRTLIAGQRERVATFLAPQVEARWRGFLAQLELV